MDIALGDMGDLGPGCEINATLRLELIFRFCTKYIHGTHRILNSDHTGLKTSNIDTSVFILWCCGKKDHYFLYTLNLIIKYLLL